MSNKFSIFMLTSWLVISSVYFCQSQDREGRGAVAEKVLAFISENQKFERVEPFQYSTGEAPVGIESELSEYTILEQDSKVVAEILERKSPFIEVRIPGANQQVHAFLLYRVDILADGFELKTDKQESVRQNEIVHYRGMIKDDEFSVVAFSFSKEEVMGFASNRMHNFSIGKLLKESRYVLYSDTSLKTHTPFSCETVSVTKPEMEENFRNDQLNRTATSKCVNFYYEVLYGIYRDKGSVANVNAYIQGAFNQVATLYANDGIAISISTIFVWTSAGPYTGSMLFTMLSQFASYRTSFNGDFAHLVGYVLGGGMAAAINSLCDTITGNKMAYSCINSTYQIVPTYSWTLLVLAHEQGHLLGSNHTHDCVWNGNNTAIDGCGPNASNPGIGNCPIAPLPSNGGTIMSYCHLIGNVGINFSNGFGSQPKKRIIKNINAASCLGSCTTCLSTPDTILGPTLVCRNSITSNVYTCTPVPDATSYTWTLPSGWIGKSNTNSITIDMFGNSGMIFVKANAPCGSSLDYFIDVKVKNSPAKPGTINGNANGVCNSTETYSINKIQGVTYDWNLTGNGGTILSGQGTDSVTVSFGNNFTTTTLAVNASNVCGTSLDRTLAIQSIPAMPDSIIGLTTPCANQQNVLYSIAPVYNAIQYEWIAPFGSTLSDGTNTSTTNKLTTPSTTVFVNYATNFLNGVRAKCINACGQSLSRNLPITFTCRESHHFDSRTGSFIIFPNPSDGKVKIKLSSERNEGFDLSIFDSTAKLVYRKHMNHSGESIELDGLRNGLYTVVLSDPDSVPEYTRLVIVK